MYIFYFRDVTLIVQTRIVHTAFFFSFVFCFRFVFCSLIFSFYYSDRNIR